MKAALRDRYGSPDVVEVREIDRPEPSEGQVLVRVRAASVNRADLDGLTPRPSFVRLFMGLRAPRNHGVGVDVAGVVESVGSGVTQLKPGDEVFGDMFIGGQGSFAEYMCAPERAFRALTPIARRPGDGDDVAVSVQLGRGTPSIATVSSRSLGSRHTPALAG